MKRFYWVALLLFCVGKIQAADAYKDLTVTVQADFLKVRVADFILTNKKVYAHMLWDAFPYAALLEKESDVKKQDLSVVRKRVMEVLLKSTLKSRAPGIRNFKVDIVEFFRRDQYGAPDWSSVKKLEHYEGSLDVSGGLVWNIIKK